MEYFSSDETLEILTRTPLKYVDRFKVVCKAWLNLTYEPRFTPLHRQRTGAVSGFFLQSLLSNKYYSKFVSTDEDEDDDNNDNNSKSLSLDFLPFPVRIEASTKQGILCCVSLQDHRSPNSFCVCKPSTGQWWLIPKPNYDRYFTIKVAVLVQRSAPLRFRILRLSSPKHTLTNFSNYPCEIFDSDTWEWRELEDILLPPRVIISHEPAVVASGRIHWRLGDNQVLAFDVQTETYALFGLPESVISKEDEFYYGDKRLLEFKGRLGFVCRASDEEDLLLWVLEDYKNHLWTKCEKLRVNAMKQAEPYFSCSAFCNAGVALMKGFNSVFFYRFSNSSFNEVKLHHQMIPTHEVFPFRSDFEPANFNGGC